MKRLIIICVTLIRTNNHGQYEQRDVNYLSNNNVEKKKKEVMDERSRALYITYEQFA